MTNIYNSFQEMAATTGENSLNVSLEQIRSYPWNRSGDLLSSIRSYEHNYEMASTDDDDLPVAGAETTPM